MSFVVKLTRLALNSDVFAITTTRGHGVYSHIHSGSVREMRFPVRPLVPMPALCDVPFFDVFCGLHSDDFKPFAIGLLWIHLGCLRDCR